MNKHIGYRCCACNHFVGFAKSSESREEAQKCPKCRESKGFRAIYQSEEVEA